MAVLCARSARLHFECGRDQSRRNAITRDFAFRRSLLGGASGQPAVAGHGQREQPKATVTFAPPNVDLDKFGVSGRLQYVDPASDQAFSPFVAVAPRWDYLPTFSDQVSARQNFNLGFNKRFNFDGDFAPVSIAGDTSAWTVWSFGLTAFVQRRLREPQLSSSALFIIPSVSYVISKDWNANFAVEVLERWFDANSAGFSRRNWEAVPIGTVEYVIPASIFGSETVARTLGRPAFDFQGSYQKVWSNSPGAGFDQWTASATLKMGWRF